MQPARGHTRLGSDEIKHQTSPSVPFEAFAEREATIEAKPEDTKIKTVRQGHPAGDTRAAV